MKTGIIFFMTLGWVINAAAQTPGGRLQSIPAQDSLKKVYPALPGPDKPSSIKYNYYQSLGAACKVELKLERATRIPFRFRLGSLQQTDYLEQKPNAQKPQ